MKREIIFRKIKSEAERKYDGAGANASRDLQLGQYY